ncbi:MAG: ribosome-associated translation inhibitor RaiA [Candidatus Poribacteria bacterium]|nr:ribosome-associated translation inhibitor RaiA [Candidatus Poribacteria bacterium]
MHISFTGRHVQITDDVRHFVEKRANKLDGVFNFLDELHVVIEQEKTRFFAELTLLARRVTFHARIETHDVFESLDTALNRIESQVRRHKERMKDRRHRQSHRDVVAQLNEGAATSSSAPTTDDSPTTAPIVKITDRFASKPLTVEDAAMQLQISEDSLLLFVNAETSQVNLLYETDSGEYGWIEPEFS